MRKWTLKERYKNYCLNIEFAGDTLGDEINPKSFDDWLSSLTSKNAQKEGC